MPASWPAKMKAKMENLPHESKPDISNLLKALEDAVYHDKDEHIWRYGEMEKVWGLRGRCYQIFITTMSSRRSTLKTRNRSF
jgi:Holliday junction resolvase RusA-like endonuclease